MLDKEIKIKFNQVSKYFTRFYEKTLKELIPALVFRKGKIGERICALDNVSFEIKKGETVGIIGPNGAGKSTILKLIAGVTQPTKGEVIVNDRVSPLIELGAGFHPELTGRENIFLNASILGLSEKEAKERFNQIVEFSEIGEFLDMPVKHYSSGMYMRLAFSVAVHTNPDILLVDEILAVGDISFQKKCLKRMEEFKKNGVTIVFVSHSMETVKNFCSRVIWLEKGEIKMDWESEKVIKSYQNNF